MRILGVVPARAGSKGLPRKNTKPIAGKSPIERAYEVGVRSGVLSRIVLSTDDSEAIQIAQSIGMEFVERPSALARDHSPMLYVVLHALEHLARTGEEFDFVMVLQPTSPLRREEHPKAAVELLRKHPDATAVCSVVPVPPERCPHYLMKITEDGKLTSFMPNGASYTRRQDVPPAHQRCGTVFLTKVETLVKEGNFYGTHCLPLELDPCDAINIDSQDDWLAAEQRLLDLENRPLSA